MGDYKLELPACCERYASMDADELTVEVGRLTKLLAAADKDSKRLAVARGQIGPDSTRARRTTAVAKWWRAAEERDRLQLMLDAANDALAVAYCAYCGVLLAGGMVERSPVDRSRCVECAPEETTVCPRCNDKGYVVLGKLASSNGGDRTGTCPDCGEG